MKFKKGMKYLLKNYLGTIAVLAIATLSFTSCSDLFEVENPNTVLEEQLEDPSLFTTLSNSAEGALSQVYSTAVVSAAMPADGVIAVQTCNCGSRFIDEGLFEGVHPYTEDLWDELAAASWTTAEVTRRLEGMVENSESDIRVAISYFWDAVAKITQADMFRAIPFNNGEPQTPIQVYEDAIQRLITAGNIANAASNSAKKTQYLAVINATIARAYRSLYFERGGDIDAFAQAADYAEKALQVDPDFYVEIRIQPPGTQNVVYLDLNLGNFFAMDPAYSNLVDPVTDELDPRITHGPFKGLGNLRGDSLFSQMKYPDGNADIPVSRWQEAELIIAEYALLNNNPSKAVDHINRVRDAAGLAPFSSNDSQRIQEQIKYERKAEFWLELRRWQDMRYYNIVPERWVPSAKEQGVDRRWHVSSREIDANPNM